MSTLFSGEIWVSNIVGLFRFDTEIDRIEVLDYLKDEERLFVRSVRTDERYWLEYRQKSMLPNPDTASRFVREGWYKNTSNPEYSGAEVSSAPLAGPFFIEVV